MFLRLDCKKLAFLLESKKKYCTFAAVRAIVSFYEPWLQPLSEALPRFFILDIFCCKSIISLAHYIHVLFII